MKRFLLIVSVTSLMLTACYDYSIYNGVVESVDCTPKPFQLETITLDNGKVFEGRGVCDVPVGAEVELSISGFNKIEKIRYKK